jgi:hypothetical protein
VTALGLVPASAGAIDLKGRFTVGVRLGDFLPADEQKGGFRFFGSQSGTATTNAVHLEEVPVGSLSLGYGLKKWNRMQMTLELEATRITSGLGKETGFVDEDASTRIELPPFFQTGQTGDERFESLPLGELTMTPVFVNALFHRSGAASERADFYFGGGLGLVLAEFEESSRYREFAADFDGSDDVQADDALGLLVKAGSNVRLAKSGNWYLYFEAEFWSTGFLTSQPQVTWSGTDFFACDQLVDMDGDGIEEASRPGCLHLVDPGHIRMDGAIGGIGLRYRFGGRTPAVAPEPAAEPVPASGT